LAEITAMREVVDLWSYYQAGDVKGMARHISWAKDGEGKDIVQYQSNPDVAPADLEQLHPDNYDVDPETGESCDVQALATTAVIASSHHHPEWLARFQPGDVFLPALVFVQRRVNERLPQLLVPQMDHDLRHDRLSVKLVPSNLLGALWLLFMQAMIERRQFRRCQQCSSWFEIRPPATRSTRIYCGDTCRIAARRARARMARDMHGQGKSAREIAATLETDVATVKRWITAKGS
jgi:hypothetical protein